MKRIIYLFALIIPFVSCNKDKPEPQDFNEFQSALTDDWVWIACEGGYLTGNGSLTLYQADEQKVNNSIFETENNKKLGDIFQSIAFWDDLAFLVVNNSGKIEVVNRYNLESLGTISGFRSPRFVEVISDTKAYVSDLFDNEIKIFNPLNYQIIDSIKTSGWTEQMVQNRDHVFCLQSAKRLVYKINKETDEMEDSIQLNFPYPNSILLDANQNLWVLCGGESWTSTNGGIYQLDKDLTVMKFFEFPTSSSGSHLTANEEGTALYYLQDGIKKMSIDAIALPTANLIKSSAGFYSFGYDSRKDEIYAGDATDYIQNGRVFRYDASGVILDDFTVGVIPSRFYFN